MSIISKMEHPTEDILERFALDAGNTASKDLLNKHLSQCEGCRAHYDSIVAYYREVDSLRNANARAAKISGQLVFAGPAVPARTGRYRGGMIWRAVAYASGHPLRTSAAALMVCAVALVSFVYTGPRPISFARPVEEFLIAYDDTGAEVWKKHIGGEFSRRALDALALTMVADESFIQVADVDGDDRKDVIVALGMVVASSSLVICYSSSGEIRWTFDLSRRVTFGETEFSDDYIVPFIRVVGAGQDGSPKIIAYGRHRSYYPSVVVRLDARTGRPEAEYWHCGWLGAFAERDFDGDGAAEFMFGGENNSFNRASVVVLDPATLSGSSPTLPANAMLGSKPGSEVAYVLFPRTELNDLSAKPRNNVSAIIPSKDGLLQMTLSETLFGGWEYTGFVYFDNDLRCVRVGESDDIDKALEMARRAGRKHVNASYVYDELKRGMRYWNGSGFGTEPVLRLPGPPSVSSSSR